MHLTPTIKEMAKPYSKKALSFLAKLLYYIQN